MTITQSFVSYGSLVQVLRENNTEERKTSSHSGVKIKISRSKKERRYYRGTREKFTDTVSAIKQMGRCSK